MATRFPGPGDFAGTYQPRSHDATDGGQSTYDGAVVVTLLTRDLVEPALPSGFALAARRDGGQLHPVIHLIGRQTNLMKLVNSAPQPLPGARDYNELILLIPFVQKGPGQNWHSYSARMYLDDPAAVGVGNAVYAYAKDPAFLTQSPAGPQTTFTLVQSLLLKPLLFQCTIAITGAWQDADGMTVPPRWADIRRILEMPVLGVDGIFGQTRNVCSYFEWNCAAAQVAPATSQHTFLSTFRDGMDNWPGLGTLVNAQDGAIALRGVQWRLALKYGVDPPPCAF